MICATGLSPRTRRNRTNRLREKTGGRSISAHAEEPGNPAQPSNQGAVYLRVRGGTRQASVLRALRQGLSPRTRRNPTIGVRTEDGGGSISAHAEEPKQPLRISPATKVYLRARGGT
ncbi:Hypothetical protein GbCGDNIH2_7112 [Granulibacter bethesdensis]|nr:Hypothetical protein GbCGDNIH2_7112 [Granulibacter bethesdensis]